MGAKKIFFHQTSPKASQENPTGQIKKRTISLNPKIARRSFLKLAAATAGITTLALSGRFTRKAEAETPKTPYPGSKIVRTICTHCAVGCGIYAEVQNGVWVRQEIAQDHPISRGGHCCKGASAIDMVRSEKRLRYPLKREGGRWKKISWSQALDEVAQKLLEIREKYGPDAVHWNGSAKVSTEMAYLQRKLAAFWGTNNIDHQARI